MRVVLWRKIDTNLWSDAESVVYDCKVRSSADDALTRFFKRDNGSSGVTDAKGCRA